MPTEPFDRNKVYYVIIGCGFSAITNHTTLHQTNVQNTNKRIDNYPVLHIGYQDPWSGYHPMPMGQWPSLLGLPGFQTPLPSLTASACLGSVEFSAANQAEWDWLLSVRPFAHLQAKVTSIQAAGTTPIEYRLTLDDDPANFVRAAYIDVCGGPGPAKELPAGVSIDPNLVSEYQTGTHYYTAWPRLVTGERYLTVSTAEPTNRSVCVVGGGATSAWCVEHAQAQGNNILWLSRESLNAAFVSSRRNDSLVAGVIRRPLVNGEHIVEGPLKPSKATTIFAEGFEPSAMDILANGKVRVHFQPIAKKFRYVNLHGRQAYPTYRDFDQVIYSIGQITDRNDLKSCANLLEPVLKSAIKRKSHIIRDRNHRAVGLRSDDDRVRVLGAAALSHPDLAPQWSTSGTRSNLLLRSFTEQARVRVGITLSAVTIAEANQLWNGTASNDNLNTAGLGDLMMLMNGLDPALDAPQTWFETRGVRIPPFTHSEFGSLMTRNFNY